jgi:regulatory protein
MKITAIEPQKHHPERVNVFVDGEFRLALAAEIAYGAHLRAGEAVAEERLRELETRDRRWKAREASLNLLSFRPRTVTELRRRLREKGFEEDIVEACLEELVERGLVDDASFAEMFTRDRVRFRPRGPRRLVQELRSKGVDAETAHAAIDEVWEREDVSEVDLAREAAAKWSLRPTEELAPARRRLFGFLARRGFGSDTIRQIMEERLPG